MAYILKNTTLTGTQNFETFDEFVQFRSSLTAYQNFKTTQDYLQSSGMVVNVKSSKVSGGWEVCRTIPNKAEYIAFISTPSISALVEDVNITNLSLGWTTKQEVVEDN